MKYWFCCLKICIFNAHIQLKLKYYQCCVLGTFWTSQKLIPSKKNQSVVIAKISSHKTQKIANPQNKLPQKFRASWQLLFCGMGIVQRLLNLLYYVIWWLLPSAHQENILKRLSNDSRKCKWEGKVSFKDKKIMT